jgi:hypothetical protein
MYDSGTVRRHRQAAAAAAAEASAAALPRQAADALDVIYAMTMRHRGRSIHCNGDFGRTASKREHTMLRRVWSTDAVFADRF